MSVYDESSQEGLANLERQGITHTGPPDLSPRLEQLEDADAEGSALVAQQVANALPGSWYAYRFPHNNPREHFLLHSPGWTGSELYASSFGTGSTHWEWGVGAMFTPETLDIPNVLAGRPICRTRINTAKSRAPTAIAKDLERRLLPDARAHWLKTAEYIDRETAQWSRYVEILGRLADMTGTPRPLLPKAGCYGVDRWSITSDNWEVEITRCGLGYKIERTGNAEDLFDVLDRIKWGADEG